MKNTPAGYKKEHEFLKEVDSLALANVQLHLEKAYMNIFRNPSIGFPRFKSKHKSHNSYTTNAVNGNIELKLSERVYRCECGNEMDRDKNAAINIREEVKRIAGHARIAC